MRRVRPGATNLQPAVCAAEVGHGAHRAVGCSDAGLGTGFLLASGDGGDGRTCRQSVRGREPHRGGQRTTGAVIGIDRTHDLALVRPASPLTGQAFRLGAKLPAVGDAAAAIGFPYGDPITLTQGHISGLDRRIPIDGAIRSGLIETDTAINPRQQRRTADRRGRRRRGAGRRRIHPDQRDRVRTPCRHRRVQDEQLDGQSAGAGPDSLRQPARPVPDRNRPSDAGPDRQPGCSVPTRDRITAAIPATCGR